MYDENLFPLIEAANHLPKRNGRKRPKATIYRWAQSGVSGVRLETIYVGGTMYTSAEAITRFFERVTRAKRNDAPRIVCRQLNERVRKELDALLEPSKAKDNRKSAIDQTVKFFKRLDSEG